jgi:hypothetical protein
MTVSVYIGLTESKNAERERGEKGRWKRGLASRM